MPNITEIKNRMDSIREMKMYDEQTDTNYMVNIVLPPDYDENREYPVFLVTDSQYWFSNLPNVWKVFTGGHEIGQVVFLQLIVTTRYQRLTIAFDGYNMIGVIGTAKGA